MKDPWLPFAYKNPGPPEKQGYGPNWSTRTQAQTEGAVYHDAVGPWDALLNELKTPGRRASWNISVPMSPIWGPDGKPYSYYQHYPLWGPGSITWHCGVVGDLETQTEIVGNLALVGIEFAREVSWEADPWTDHQLRSAVEIQRYIDRPEPFELGRNAWEHAWLKATGCPNGRNRWSGMELALNSGGADEMTEDETRQMIEGYVDPVEANIRKLEVGHDQLAAAGHKRGTNIHALYKQLRDLSQPFPPS